MHHDYSGRFNSRWYKALHLFYAGLYAFVLPLICWGAQATPGHPHLRAHFVFAEPIVHEELFSQPVPQKAHSLLDWLATTGGKTDCHTDPVNTELEPIDTPEPDLPAGRSVPSQLALVNRPTGG